MRVTTALNRLLRLRGASVIDVSFDIHAIIVTVRLRWATRAAVSSRRKKVSARLTEAYAPSSAARSSRIYSAVTPP